MFALYPALLAAAWLVEAADENESRHVHGTVAFIRSGERTPIIVPTSGKLTALGARQMQELGQMFRGRYIGDDAYNGLGHDPISGLSPDILDPTQLFIQTQDRPYLQASAQAFMQGLYPPAAINGNNTGAVADATGILANGTAIDAPLGGYQYAPIQVLSEWDPQSIYIRGDQNCPLSIRETLMYQTTEHYLETMDSSRGDYESLDASLFGGLLEQSQIDYFNAIQIYDYLSYAYTHDETVHDTLANDAANSGLLDRLRYYADESAWYFWGNTSASSSDNDIRAMAGRTLAALILGQFQSIFSNAGSTTNGNSQPLTLLFGDQEPLISLISLLMLDHRNPNFRSIPPFASAIVFELFSIAGDGAFPTNPENLWINFHFHNGSTGFDGDLRSYPIFGHGSSGTDMPWLEFENMMSRIMTNDLLDWCTQCASSALFCWGVDGSAATGGELSRHSNHKGSKISPAVGGIIGAVVTLAVAGLVFAAAMLLGGLRVHRVESRFARRKSDLGGFKGSAKLASDADLSLPRHGAVPAGAAVVGSGTDTRKPTHERVGSWELRQKEFGPRTGDLGDREPESPRGSFEAIEAAMARPVQPNERV